MKIISLLFFICVYFIFPNKMSNWFLKYSFAFFCNVNVDEFTIDQLDKYKTDGKLVVVNELLEAFNNSFNDDYQTLINKGSECAKYGGYIIPGYGNVADLLCSKYYILAQSKQPRKDDLIIKS